MKLQLLAFEIKTEKQQVSTVVKYVISKAYASRFLERELVKLLWGDPVCNTSKMTQKSPKQSNNNCCKWHLVKTHY